MIKGIISSSYVYDKDYYIIRGDGEFHIYVEGYLHMSGNNIKRIEQECNCLLSNICHVKGDLNKDRPIDIRIEFTLNDITQRIVKLTCGHFQECDSEMSAGDLVCCYECEDLLEITSDRKTKYYSSKILSELK